MRTANIRTLMVVPLLLLALAVGACGSDDATAPKSSSSQGKQLVIGTQAAGALLAYYVAQHQGYLKQAGVSGFKVTLFTSLPPLFAAAGGGNIDFGIQTLPGIVGYNKAASSGKNLKIIGAGSQATSVFIGSKKSGLPQIAGDDWQSVVRAWRGKKIGVPALGGIQDKTLRSMLQQVGLDPASDVKVTAVAQGAPAAAALKKGLIDVFVGEGVTMAVVEGQDAGEPLITAVKGQGPDELDTVTAVMFASSSRLAKDPKLFEGVQAAVDKARAFMRTPDGPKVIHDVMVEDLKYTPDIADRLIKNGGWRPYAKPLTREGFDSTVSVFEKTGLLEPPAPTWDGLVEPYAK
jgi:ABC-type nitrate/sulfonate/bicarbonate transport system substrate-binding protein